MLVIAGLPLTVSSVRNHLFLLQRLKLAKDHIWCHWYPFDYAIHQESSLSPFAYPLNTANPIGCC